MKIKNESSFIEFELTDFVDFRHDVACRIQVFCEGFGGIVNSVWFSEQDVKSFIEQIEELEKTRKGSAELSNMGSLTDINELEFIVFSTDSLGHIAIRAILQKTYYPSNSADFRKIEILKTSVAFEIDPSSLNTIISDFKKLFMI